MAERGHVPDYFEIKHPTALGVGSFGCFSNSTWGTYWGSYGGAKSPGRERATGGGGLSADHQRLGPLGSPCGLVVGG